MSEMIERVARAICLDAGRMGDTQAIEQQRVDRDWRNHTSSARAAIQAMRKPTDNMKRAVGDLGGMQALAYANASWPTMIDAALEENP